MINILVSHKGTEKDVAEWVACQVRSNGLETHLESMDRALSMDGPELTRYLLNRMEECQHLIAVLSNETSEAWWVPWEIGAGSEKGLCMASFSQDDMYIPGFLEKWPVLKSASDIDLYCDYSKKEDRKYITALERIQHAHRSASNFHKDLKMALLRTTR